MARNDAVSLERWRDLDAMVNALPVNHKGELAFQPVTVGDLPARKLDAVVRYRDLPTTVLSYWNPLLVKNPGKGAIRLAVDTVYGVEFSGRLNLDATVEILDLPAPLDPSERIAVRHLVGQREGARHAALVLKAAKRANVEHLIVHRSNPGEFNPSGLPVTLFDLTATYAADHWLHGEGSSMHHGAYINFNHTVPVASSVETLCTEDRRFVIMNNLDAYLVPLGELISLLS